MVPLFFVDDFLIFIPYKDEIDEVYVSHQEDFNIEDDGELNKYLRIDLDRRPDGSIHLRQPYLTQITTNMITGMERLSANPNPTVKPPHEKN